MRGLKSYFPIIQWAYTYKRAQFSSDATAALIVTIMLIPQSMAYALLAGLPPHIGLYASILPLLGYMIFGTSNALAVGPVAVVSLMTAASIGTIAETGTAGYLAAAIMLALLSGGILLLMGLFRLGFLSDFFFSTSTTKRRACVRACVGYSAAHYDSSDLRRVKFT